MLMDLIKKDEGGDHVIKLLNEVDNIDVKYESNITPLHKASELGHTRVVKKLLEKGANVAAKDKVQIKR